MSELDLADIRDAADRVKDFGSMVKSAVSLDVRKKLDFDEDDDEMPSTSKGLTLFESTRMMASAWIDRMPDCVWFKVLGFLSFDEASKIRVTCKRLDLLCRSRLNSGFRSSERFHARIMREFKSKLPRRESERRNHPLSRHCDILTAVETRISLLSMTFMKYVDVDMCCFIPGKVIDEIYKVLRSVQSDKTPPRAFELLQELRDISSMAMEHFDEKIVPTLRLGGELLSSPKFQTPSSYLPVMVMSASRRASVPGGPAVSLQDVCDRTCLLEQKFKTADKRNRKVLADTKKRSNEIAQTVKDQSAAISGLESLVASQKAIISSQAESLSELTRRLSHLERVMSGSGVASTRPATKRTRSPPPRESKRARK